MRFEIPFEEASTRKQSAFLFDSYWKKQIKENKKSIYFSTVFVLFGMLIKYGGDNIGFIFMACGIFLLFNCLHFFSVYNKNKKIYFEAIDNTVSTYLANNSITVWVFLDDWFCYADFKFDIKIKWDAIKTFKVIEDIIVFEVRDNIYSNFFLEKEEVGNHDFEKIILFVESKIKNNGIL